MLVETLPHCLLVGSLYLFKLLQHRLDTVDCVSLVDFDQSLNLLPLIEIIFIVFLAMKEPQYFRVVGQVVQLLLKVQLFGLVLLCIVILDADLIQFE